MSLPLSINVAINYEQSFKSLVCWNKMAVLIFVNIYVLLFKILTRKFACFAGRKIPSYTQIYYQIDQKSLWLFTEKVKAWGFQLIKRNQPWKLVSI